MSAPPEPAEASPETWLRYAAENLVAAERALLPPPLSAMACFHAQQAAEKALKGYPTSLTKQRVPRIHDLSRLSSRVVASGGSAPPRDALAVLNAYASGVRYPDVPPPSEAEACEAFALARQVVAFVRTQPTPPDPQ